MYIQLCVYSQQFIFPSQSSHLWMFYPLKPQNESWLTEPEAMSDPNSYFKKGVEVEISSNDHGFRGSWYTGTIVRPATKSRNKVLVEYNTLMEDEAGLKRLRETLDLVQLRPPAPRERSRTFKFSEEVDAYCNDGWWEGVITEVHENEKCSVFFRGTREQMIFGKAEMRLHREWVNGNWVPPLEEDVENKTKKVSVPTEAKPIVEREEEKFSPGTAVEVSSDEDGFQGAWFAATVIKQLSKDKFLIEYQCLRNDDDTQFLKEEVDSSHIRPSPPDSIVMDQFNVLEEVDALYNDGWWVGVISKVLVGRKYIVYFRTTNEEMEFQHSELRLHRDWIDGTWVMTTGVF